MVNVTQDKQEWKYNELDIIGYGELSTNELTAGIWKGNFNFEISLESSTSSESPTPSISPTSSESPTPSISPTPSENPTPNKFNE